MALELRPQEDVVIDLLKKFTFDKEQIENFVEYFFLRRIILNRQGVILEFLYLEGVKPTLDFTQNVEYYFKMAFQDNLICEFCQVSRSRLLTYKYHRKGGERWDNSFLPLEPPKTATHFEMPHEFIPTQFITAPNEHVSKKFADIKVEVETITLTNQNSVIAKPSTKPSKKKNIVDADKIFVEKVSDSVKKISEIYLMNKETSHKVVIVGDLMNDEINGAKLREFKSGTCAVSFALSDDTDGIVCKKIFDDKEQAEDFQSRLKDLSRIKIKGTARLDKFTEEMSVLIEKIQPIDTSTNIREDNAEVKRVELHVHTTMSAMDAIISPEKLITTAANWNWSAVAITDHGVIQAFPAAADTVEKLAKKGKHIKVIYGMEGYLTTEENQKYAYHVILLAKNKVGLGNLYRLVSISQLKYFYRKPRIPKEILAKFREGLIIGSACAQGELISAILDGKDDAEIDEIANFYDYIEIQPIGNNEFIKKSERFPTINSDEDLQSLNRRVADIAQKLNKPLVATCDAHFLNPEDKIFRAIMMSGKGFDDADNQPPIFLRTTEEMLKEFDYLDKDLAYKAVVENPNIIADSIEELKPIPDGLYSPQMPGADAEITEMSYKRAMTLYGDPLPKIVKERLEQELKPITTHGFSVLYLIAQKLVKKSNDDGYLVGSRGSVGSSFVAAMTGITEVNPLPPHYRCPKCQHSEFFTKGEVSCGYDLPNKNCPICGHPLIKDGHDIPFAVFLGFDGDKVPDIDLNFSGEYQSAAHKYTEILFGRHNVYRAGTISTVAEKTAYGFVRKYYEERGEKKHGSFIAKMASGFTGVKRTTGQHPAGIMVVPRDMDIHYFTPIQRPAEDKTSTTITTHFDYHSISSRLVKLDILGHDDPTVIKMLENITHIDPLKIPLDDKPTLSLFNSTKAIGLKPSQIGTNSGTFGIPEFRTSFTRAMIDDTSPKCFSDLVRISGFSHGTDVWLGNAQELIKNQICTLQDAISARDDIMMYLIHNGVDSLKAFKIMEGVRKGKGIKPEDVEDLKSHNVPDWYIDSCQKIKYLFPRAHATAYVMMAYRIAYCKVHYPLAYYSAYFSIRADEFNADEIVQGENFVKMKIEELEKLSQTRKLELKENEKLAVLQVAYEMFLRGMGVEHVNLYESDAEKFIVLERENKLLPPLSSLVGVGTVAARNIAKARKDGEFSSIQDLVQRAGINKTAVEALKKHGSLNGMEETNQISLFGF